MSGKNEVTLREDAAAFAGPAPAVNRFVIASSPHGQRVAFVEVSAGGENHFRGAVFVSDGDAAALRDALTAVLDARTRQLEPQPRAN